MFNFFRPKPVQADAVVYLAYAPYYRPRRPGEDPLAVKPSYSANQEKLSGYLLRWALINKLLKTVGDEGQIAPLVDHNYASLSHIFHIENFQHLVYQSKLDEIIAMLPDNNTADFRVTKFQQLTIFLLGYFEPDFIHYHINRTYQAFDFHPMEGADRTWADIHQQYPFMWVLLTIHLLVKNTTDPV